MVNSTTPQNPAASSVIEQALQKAQACRQAGQVQEAETLYQSLLELHPEHPEAHHGLGVLALQMGQPVAAIPRFISALEADPACAQYWLSYIEALFLSGQTEAAREVFAHARQQGLQGEVVDALAQLLDEGVAETDQPTASIASAPSPIAAQRGDSAGKSVGLSKSAGKLTPNKNKRPDAQEINTLTALFTEGRYADAGALAQGMTERFPNYGFGWKVLGGVFHQLGRNQEAVGPMKKAVALLPNDAAVHSNLGIVLSDLGWLDEALASYRRALKIQPNYIMALSNLGNTLHEMGRLDEAEASYRRALKIKPDYVEALGNLGITLQGLGRFDEAVASYQRALAVNPAFVEAHSNLGKTLQDMGRLDEAEASYRRALEIKPDYAEALSNLGNLLQELGRTNEAEASYLQALSISPNYAEAHGNLGITLQSLGRPEEAEVSYRRALEIKPDYAEGHNNLALVLQESGRVEEARASYLRALEIRPDYVDALLNMGHLLCNLDDFAQAVEAYQQVARVDPASRGLEATVNLAILNYLNSNPEQCRSDLLASQALVARDDRDYKNHRIYWLYLDKLLSCQRQSAGGDLAECLGTLHVLGDSHTLSTHGMVVRHEEQDMQCVAEWIAGCKQWHLASSEPNKYKHKFEKVMARLPLESSVLLSIGEIDCRPDEGMLKVWEKHPEKSLDEIVQSTVDSYLAYVAATSLQYGHKMIVGGVPRSNIPSDSLAPDMARQLAHLIQIFNDALKEQALAAGMSFLDVHALTDRGDGSAASVWHLDEIHLKPDAVVEAFERYCIRP